MSLALVVVTMQLCFASAGYGQEESGGDRGGFTALLSLGWGVQNDQFLESTESGLAGLNFGIGGFLNPDVALIFRASGTNVRHERFKQVSGVGGPAIQYWVSDRLSVESGMGLGFWSVDDTYDRGLGLIFGVAHTLVRMGNHTLRIGIEYAPAFTDPDMVHNLGFVAGWQLL